VWGMGPERERSPSAIRSGRLQIWDPSHLVTTDSGSDAGDFPGFGGVGIGQFRFLHAACLANLKGSFGLILEKVSVMRISIPLDLSSRSFIPLPCFIRSRRPIPLLAPSLVLFPQLSAKRHMLGAYFRALSAFLLIIVLA